MKFDTSKMGNMGLVVGAIVVALLAYWFFFTGAGNNAPLTVNTTGNEAASKFQSLLGELQPITFNTAIFSDPRFTALVDLATPVVPEPSGRPDPFAVIPGVTGQ